MKTSTTHFGFCLFTLLLPLAVAGQNTVQTACENLKTAAFEAPFDWERIEAQKKAFGLALENSSPHEFSSCNCADTLWIALRSDRRPFIKQTHGVKLDTVAYLRGLVAEVDIMNLSHEFNLYQFETLEDSFHYVMERMRAKDERRHVPEYNWMKFYHCIEAESSFFKDHKYRLLPAYLGILDDESQPFEIKDRILTSFFYSDEPVEEIILARIDAYVGDRLFYRMLGILRTSGTSRSVEHLTGLLEANSFDLNTTKLVLQAIYGITDRRKVERKARKQFENYLEETRLDTLSRYDLFTTN